MTEYKTDLNRYRGLNSVAEKGGVVLFGSSFAKNIPVSELRQTFHVDCNIYNRSFENITVNEALIVVKEVAMSIEPKKILIQIGEDDLKQENKSIDEIVDNYGKLINKIKSENAKTKIVVVSVCSDDARSSQLNRELEKLAGKFDCQYADITKTSENESVYISAFNMLSFFIIDNLSFSDVMKLAG